MIPFLFRKWMIRFICAMFNFLLFYNEPNQCVFNSAFHRPILRSNNDQSTLRQTYLLLCCKMNWSNQSNYLIILPNRHTGTARDESQKVRNLISSIPASFVDATYRSTWNRNRHRGRQARQGRYRAWGNRPQKQAVFLLLRTSCGVSRRIVKWSRMGGAKGNRIE